jgi:hypothetical protein
VNYFHVFKKLKHNGSINNVKGTLYKFKVDTDFISLKLIFKSNKIVSNYVFDWNSMEINSFPHRERVTPNKRNFDKLISKLKYSQIIIQNQHDEYRYFYIGKRKNGFIYDENLQYSIPIDPEIFDINKEVILESGVFLRENLKIRDNDHIVKFHYFFVPNKDLKSKGYKRDLFSTGWVDISQ